MIMLLCIWGAVLGMLADQLLSLPAEHWLAIQEFAGAQEEIVNSRVPFHGRFP